MTRDRTAYALFAITLAALIGYACASLFSVGSTATNTPLILLNVAVTSGLLGGGIYAFRSASLTACVWTLGIGLIVLAKLIALLSPNLAPRATAAEIHVANVLAAFALVYWLISRYSTVSAVWATLSLRVVTVLVVVIGLQLTLAPLLPFGVARAILIPLLTLIVAAHNYRPLANRSDTNTLAPHWVALSLVLLIGVGFVGGVQALPTIQAITDGTALAALPAQATRWAIMAIILGVINQAATELRGDGRRITGLAPFWLVAFGTISASLLLAGIGLVQVYVERLVGVSHAETETLLTPLYLLLSGAYGLLLAGLLLYGFLLWLRRPKK